MKNKKKNKGFAAFILVITISSLMLALNFMQGTEYALFFDQVQRKEYRLMSYYFSYSCLDQAILALSHDYFFNLQKEIEIPILNCFVESVVDRGNNEKIISVYGKYKNIIVNREARVKLFDDHLEIISIQ